MRTYDLEYYGKHLTVTLEVGQPIIVEDMQGNEFLVDDETIEDLLYMIKKLYSQP